MLEIELVVGEDPPSLSLPFSSSILILQRRYDLLLQCQSREGHTFQVGISDSARIGLNERCIMHYRGPWQHNRQENTSEISDPSLWIFVIYTFRVFADFSARLFFGWQR